MPSGGYRRPEHPAPVSGPGALSKRTDGKQPLMSLPDAKYGEQQAFQNAQQAAPVSESAGGMGAAGSPPQGPDLSSIVPMGAPTQNPGEPITAGMPQGPGPGSTMPPTPPTLSPADAQRLQGYIPTLVLLASREDASPATKQFVRQLRAELG
jgi:hypothetical protein